MATSPTPRGESSDLSGPATIEDSLEACNTQTLIATEADNVASTTTAVKAQTRTRKRKQVDYEVKEEEDGEASVDIVATTSKRRKAIATTTTEQKTKTTRKTKTKPAEMAAAPLMARTSAAKMLIGAHVSMAKGVQNAITNSVNIGGNALALFLKSQRKWVSPDMKEGDAEAFREACKTHSYDPRKHILPHGSYLINLAQPDEAKATQAYDCFLDDLKRCERLGIGLYNFHPGSTLGKPRQEALGRIAKALNKAHKETEFCKTVIENMAGHGNIIGGDFEDLRDIIKDVEDKSRVGVCLDTCHLFAAGHDIRTKEAYNAVLTSFDEIVGLRYLSALHLNDSKAPLGSRRDLHQNIGLGYLGIEPFRLIMNDHRLAGLPMILETPTEENPQVWADEIKLLESFIGKAGDEEDFLETARNLQAKGAPERQKVGAVVERKAKEKEKKGTSKRGPKKKKAKPESEEDESEGCSH